MPIESENSAGDASASSDHQPPPPPPPPAAKKKRNLPGMPDPDAEVMALSPKTLMATNRFVCEICNKGFQRDQNLQLHRRGHNLPWKLRQRTAGSEARKRVYICPEPGCVHHDPSRALGDLTGIKKHFSRKHGEKKWKCDKCSKKYAVQSDWKAHAKTCGTREYRCDCGTLFSRRDSFITHRAFCDALTEECAKTPTTAKTNSASEEEKMELAAEPVVIPTTITSMDRPESEGAAAAGMLQYLPPSAADGGGTSSGTGNGSTSNSIFASLFSSTGGQGTAFSELIGSTSTSLPEPTPLCLFSALAAHQFAAPPPPQQSSPHMSATALLQKAAQMGATTSGSSSSSFLRGFGLASQQEEDGGGSLQWGSHNHNHNQTLDAGLGLGLAYDNGNLMMGPKLATLDLLGLGIGPEGPGAGGFLALISSMGGGGGSSSSGGGLDVGPGTSPTSWEGADRNPAIL